MGGRPPTRPVRPPLGTGQGWRPRRRIRAACVAAGRPEDDVALVVVTKFFPASDVRLLADLGTARIVGEQRLHGVGTGAGDGMVAPEVVEGFAATQESDVYQLGALARFAVTGEAP